MILASVYQESDPASIQQQAVARPYLQAAKKPTPGIEMAINHYLKKLHVKIALALCLPPAFNLVMLGSAYGNKPGRDAASSRAGAGWQAGSPPRPHSCFSSLSGQVSEAKNKSMTVCEKGQQQ